MTLNTNLNMAARYTKFAVDDSYDSDEPLLGSDTIDMSKKYKNYKIHNNNNNGSNRQGIANTKFNKEIDNNLDNNLDIDLDIDLESNLQETRRELITRQNENERDLENGTFTNLAARRFKIFSLKTKTAGIYTFWSNLLTLLSILCLTTAILDINSKYDIKNYTTIFDINIQYIFYYLVIIIFYHAIYMLFNMIIFIGHMCYWFNNLATLALLSANTFIFTTSNLFRAIVGFIILVLIIQNKSFYTIAMTNNTLPTVIPVCYSGIYDIANSNELEIYMPIYIQFIIIEFIITGIMMYLLGIIRQITNESL